MLRRIDGLRYALADKKLLGISVFFQPLNSPTNGGFSNGAITNMLHRSDDLRYRSDRSKGLWKL
jgi:hypothetical protein